MTANAERSCTCDTCHQCDRWHSERIGPDDDGNYLDPVTGVRMPGKARLLPNPNRKQRRRLAAWRKKVSR